MKKVLMILTICLGVLVVTGCGKTQKLNCSREEDTMKIEMNFTFKSDKVTGLVLNYKLDLSEYNDIQLEAVGKQDFCSVLKSSLAEYGEAFNNCSQKIESKNLYVTTDLDIDELSDGVRASMSSLEAAKSSMESANYTCTVK